MLVVNGSLGGAIQSYCSDGSDASNHNLKHMD